MFESIFHITVHVVVITIFFALLATIIAVVVVYLQDIRQSESALRRNYPVLAHFRYTLEELGVFLRQYFFSTDRDERPFNRAERGWVYKAAKNVEKTAAFGSTQDFKSPQFIFINSPFPTLEKDCIPSPTRRIGMDNGPHYDPASFFNISGMSYGSLSKPAIQALSRGAYEAGIWMNTGEGGLSPYHLEGNCDIVMQIGTAKFGVRNHDGSLSIERLKEIASHPQVKMFEIKLSQGAKPGKGGILPAIKVNGEISRIRGVPEGVDAISPNRHEDIACLDDLLNMIDKVRTITNKPVGIKTALSTTEWIEGLCDKINERGFASAPDFITLDGGDGGSGAAPMVLMDSVALPLRNILPSLVDALERKGLKNRIKIIASGKLITPSDIAWALCVGADFVNSARGFMFSLGCIQAMQCHKDTCPTGITTHNPILQKGLKPAQKYIRVANYVKRVRDEVEMIAHSCGLRHAREFSRKNVMILHPSGLVQRLDKI